MSLLRLAGCLLSPEEIARSTNRHEDGPRAVPGRCITPWESIRPYSSESRKNTTKEERRSGTIKNATTAMAPEQHDVWLAGRVANGQLAGFGHGKCRTTVSSGRG